MGRRCEHEMLEIAIHGTAAEARERLAERNGLPTLAFSIAPAFFVSTRRRTPYARASIKVRYWAPHRATVAQLPGAARRARASRPLMRTSGPGQGGPQMRHATSLFAVLLAALALSPVAPARADDESRLSGILQLDLTNAYFFRGILNERDGLIAQPWAELYVSLIGYVVKDSRKSAPVRIAAAHVVDPV